jgi:hypothetical protein
VDGRFVYHEAVFRRAAGVLAGVDDQRAGAAQLALSALQSTFYQRTGERLRYTFLVPLRPR